MTKPDEEKVQELHTTALDNMYSEYSSVIEGVNVSKLQMESGKALQKAEYSCEKCNSQEDLVFKLDEPVEEFESKERAINANNLVALCKECYHQAEGTAVSQYSQGSDTDTVSMIVNTLRNFEQVIASNTPSLIVRNSIPYILYLTAVFIVGSLGYGVYSEQYTAVSYLTTVLGSVGNGIGTVFIDYTFGLFLIAIPIVAIYTVFEYYEPRSYTTERYVQSWNFGSISIPYIFHPIALVVSTIGFSVLGFLGESGRIASTGIVSVVGVALLFGSIGLFLTLPTVFTQIVRSDKSTIRAKEQLAEVSEKITLSRYDNIIITGSGKKKPRVRLSDVDEYYIDYTEDLQLTDSYYGDLLWVFAVHLSVTFVGIYLIQIGLLGAELGGLAVLLFISPTIIVGLYLLYRYIVIQRSVKKIEDSSEKIESESSVGGK
jgi:hypothetical protein